MPRARDEKKKKSQERAVAFFQDVVHRDVLSFALQVLML
jgi:hypothetical protein